MLGLEGLDLLLDARLALGKGVLASPVLFALRGPVLGLLGGLEGRVFADRGVGVSVDLLNVLGANTVREVGGELLLEAVGMMSEGPFCCEYLLTARHPPPRATPYTRQRGHQIGRAHV